MGRVDEDGTIFIGGKAVNEPQEVRGMRRICPECGGTPPLEHKEGCTVLATRMAIIREETPSDEEPIACPECGGVDWRTTWTGRFSEDITISWQSHIDKPTYVMGFENEDQYDTDTERWRCDDCGHEADDEVYEALEAMK